MANQILSALSSVSFIHTPEDEIGKVKSKTGYDLIKVGKVSREKASVYVGKVAFIPSISMEEIKSELGEMGTEAATILHSYFTDARSAYVRERIIDGLSELPSSLLQFEKRNLWLAFAGINAEAANLFIAQVIQTRCEEFAFNAAAKKMGFTSLEDVPEEKSDELINLQSQFLPTFIKAASSDRNREFLLSLVQEGRILSRYGKFSEAQCSEGIKWVTGVDSPIALKVIELLNMRIEAIKNQVAAIGMDSEELAVMAEYFKL